MANRKKRIERELILVQNRERIKKCFKKEKQKRKVGQKAFLETFLNAKNQHAFKGIPRKKEYLFLYQTAKVLKNRDRQGYREFLKILRLPKPIFSNIHLYEKLAESLIYQSPCRSFESWKMPKSKNENVIFKSLFFHLLVAYKVPKSIEDTVERYIRYFVTKDCKEVDIMFHMINGKGIHQFPNLKLKMNSKMNFLLNQAPPHLKLPKAMWWAKIKSMGASYSIASKLVDNFYIEVNTTWDDWYDDLIFFLNRFSEIGRNDLKKILDFIITQKKGGVNINIPNSEEKGWVPALFPDFKLKGRTIASVLKYVEKWRTYVQIAKDAGTIGEFKTSAIRAMRIKQGKRLIRIRQITNLKNLALEGNKMNHCVATYAGECLSGASSIWSMNEILAVGKMKRLITIEVEESTKKVLQASGNSNRDLKEMEKKWLKAWVEKEGLINDEESLN